jgi:CelD/BcsL family acetyltransferase involved in cellulose biosynthesis
VTIAPFAFRLPAAAGLRAFGDDWRRLAQKQHPFVGPEWLALTASLLTSGEPTVLVARRGGSVSAGLALVLDPRTRTLSALTSEHTPRFDLVGDPAALPELWACLRADPRWDRLELAAVPGSSVLATELLELARQDGYLAAVAPGPSSPYFALDGFAERLDAKFRANLRRRARRLGTVSLERITRFDADAFEDGAALEAAAWKGAAGTALVCDPRVHRFYRAVAHALARRGQLALTFLRAGARRIAFHFALEHEGVYYLVKPGYDPAFARFGPGQLLVYEAATDAAWRGLTEFDFLGWDMPWKREWTQTVRPHSTVCIYRPTVAGRLQHAARHVLRPRIGSLWRAIRSLRK